VDVGVRAVAKPAREELEHEHSSDVDEGQIEGHGRRQRRERFDDGEPQAPQRLGSPAPRWKGVEEEGMVDEVGLVHASRSVLARLRRIDATIQGSTYRAHVQTCTHAHMHTHRSKRSGRSALRVRRPVHHMTYR
jgi:hypothetical protein